MRVLIATKPHKYEADTFSNAVPALCGCGYAHSWRYHQPWWWRLLNPDKRWRE